MEYDQSEEKSFNVNVNSEELQNILNQIDQKLNFDKPPLPNMIKEQQPATQPFLPLESLTGLGDWIKMSSAPLQPSIIGGVRGFIWRILNFPVRIFLPSEIVFNRKLREFIGELMASMYAINAFAQKMEASIALLDQKMEMLVKANQEMKEGYLKLKSQFGISGKSQAGWKVRISGKSQAGWKVRISGKP